MTLDPTTLAGKRLWLRGKDLGTAGSAVTTWADQSGAGNHATGVNPSVMLVEAASTPAGGKAVNFAGSAYLAMPQLASNGSGAATATASSSFFSEPPANAIDGVTTTHWTTNGVVAAWLRFQYPTAITSTQYTIRRRDDIPARNAKDWTFEGSNDGTAWTVLDTRTGITWPTAAETKTFTFTNATAYTYYRLNITANSGDTYTSVTEFTQNGATVPAAAEVWIVVKSGASASSRAMWRMSNTSLEGFYPFSNGRVYEDFGLTGADRQDFAPTLAVNAWRLYRVANDGTTWQAWLDNTSQLTASGKAIRWAPAPKIGDSGTTSYFAGGRVAEVLIRDQVSTSSEVAWLIDYFNTEHGLSVAGGSAPVSGISGSVAGSLPALTGSVAGTVAAPPVTGVVAGALPALTGSSTGTYTAPSVGAVAATLPALTASVAGTHVSNDQVGAVAATLPALSGAVVGSFVAAPVSGPAAATLPSLTGDVAGATGVVGAAPVALPPLTGGVTGSAGTLLGSVHATLPALSPGVAGLVTTGVVPPSVDDPTVLILDTVGGELDLIGPLDALPPGMTQRPLWRRSVIVPNLKDVPGVVIDPVTQQPRIPAEVYATFDVIEEEVGVPHVIFPGRDGSHDATYYRGNRTQILSDRREEPFGDTDAQIAIPVITSMDDDPDGFTSPHPWTKIRANMEIVLRKSDASISRVWAGNVFERNVGNQGQAPFLRITAIGSVHMAANAINKPLNRQDPLDLGYLIPRTLNTVVSRRYNAVPHVTTGILSKKRGSWSDNALGFVQDCLADAWTLSGNQWTVAKIPGTRRAYEMRLKKTTPSWTITNGAMGVDVDLTKDGAVRNVIYGHGVNGDGGVWRNTYYFHGADPNEGVRLPLAADQRTQKRILHPSGLGMMDNPDYDENIPAYEDDVDFGQNSRTIGIRSAEQILDRESTPSLTGRITLRTDPREGSRVFIPPGDKIKLIGYEGRDVVLHIAAVERNWQTYEVTLEVDERSRDALTLAQIRSLQKEARRDPALRPGNPNRRSRLEQDQVVPFDADSIAGIIQPRSAPGGQWSGQAYPFAGGGRIVKTHFEAGSPFSVAIFAKPISAAHLQSIVGNPLMKDNPFEPHLKVLENTYGMVACWGQKGQRMGYSPGREDSTPPGPFTGDFDEYSTWEYVSGDGVKLWVYVFPQSSTTFSGRCYPGSEL